MHQTEKIEWFNVRGRVDLNDKYTDGQEQNYSRVDMT